MLPVIFKLIVTQPQRLLDHFSNYADLMAEELQHALVTWRVLLLLYVLSAVCLGLSIFCAAAAMLLWGALPTLNAQNAWVLWALPLFTFAASWLLYEAAKRYRNRAVFKDMQEQISLDMLAIRHMQAHEK